uniref:Protein kinase domain-containing protein n=1 Tax=Meloidogyne hapla TaxID=6305 RepID=A0A1I8BL75_MELHA
MSLLMRDCCILKSKDIFLLLFIISNYYCYSLQLNKNEEKLSNCGKYTVRNKTNKLIVDGKVFDTVVPLGNGYDSKVSLLIFNDIVTNQKCGEETLFSDFLRVVIIGSNRRKREIAKKKSLSNCTLVTSVIELGEEDATKHWQRLNSKGYNSDKELEQLNKQILRQLDKLHEKGLAHCDIHPDNILLFPNGTSINSKLIDYGWSCCFNSAKCGNELSKVVPLCEKDEALLDDKINMDGLIEELRQL